MDDASAAMLRRRSSTSTVDLQADFTKSAGAVRSSSNRPVRHAPRRSHGSSRLASSGGGLRAAFFAPRSF